jgi:hypothetical protein
VQPLFELGSRLDLRWIRRKSCGNSACAGVRDGNH